MLKVYKECCKNCLLSADSIVSPERKKDIIRECVKEKTHFFCHKSTMVGKNIICKKFFDEFGHHSTMVRIAESLNMIEYVEQPNQEKLPTYNEMKK